MFRNSNDTKALLIEATCGHIFHAPFAVIAIPKDCLRLLRKIVGTLFHEPVTCSLIQKEEISEEVKEFIKDGWKAWKHYI